NTEAREIYIAIRVAIPIKNSQSLVPHARQTVGSDSGKIRTKRGGYPSQRRMLRLVSIDSFGEPFYPGGDMRRFVGGMTKYAVGAHDAQRTYDYQEKEYRE